MFLVTALTLGAIAVYAALVYWQYRTMIAATVAAQQAVVEARLNRAQADKVVDATIEHFRLDQRAWVPVKSVTLTTPYSLTQHGEVTVSISNNGKTPALDAYIVNAGMGTTPNLIMTPVSPKSTVIASAGDVQFYLDMPPNPTGVKIYIKVVIRYLDIFQKSTDKPHSTIFCGYYPTTQPPHFFSCDHGGWMD